MGEEKLNTNITNAQTKPDDMAGRHRTIQITSWRPHEKKTLKGFCSATLPSGMVIHDLTVHERGGDKWVSYPSREWVDQKGEKQFSPIIGFTNRSAADHFRDQVLEALGRYFSEVPD